MAGPAYHGRTHAPGGTDPIPGGGGATVFGAGWAGPYPLNILTGATWKVPKVDGADTTFDLQRALFRLETPATAGDTVVSIYLSAGGNVAFSGSLITTLTLPDGDYEVEDTTSLGQVDSGDLLRIQWGTVGTNARGYLVMLEGAEA